MIIPNTWPWAVLSEDALYRYALGREVNPGVQGTVLWVMLNPSTADATNDDRTIQRCKQFSRDWGYGRMTVGNLYAWRATNPAELKTVASPIGQDNYEWLETMADHAEVVVVAWGGHAEPSYAADIARMLRRRAPVCCLGVTKTEQPRHPLYLAKDTPLELY